jgi:hypothetical protein
MSILYIVWLEKVKFFASLCQKLFDVFGIFFCTSEPTQRIKIGIKLLTAKKKPD